MTDLPPALDGLGRLCATRDAGRNARIADMLGFTLAAPPGRASVDDYAKIEEDGRRPVLCHYPFRSWNG